MSEITILPDGRVYVLGVSPAVLEVLRASGPWATSPGSAARRESDSEPLADIPTSSQEELA